MFRRKYRIEWYAPHFSEPGQRCFTLWGAERLAARYNRYARQRGFTVRTKVVQMP